VAKEATLNEVIGWLMAALEAARADAGGEEGRRLSVTFYASSGRVDNVEVVTWNLLRRPPGPRWEYGRETSDGAFVVWVTDPLGIPSGVEWLPEDFVRWIMGERWRW
jgi:hypothetical protein